MESLPAGVSETRSRGLSVLPTAASPARVGPRSHMPLRVFVVCWLVYAVFWSPYIVREHFPALTLSETGSLNAHRYLGWSDDIFPMTPERAFINNNPGASITGAIPLILF